MLAEYNSLERNELSYRYLVWYEYVSYFFIFFHITFFVQFEHFLLIPKWSIQVKLIYLPKTFFKELF